MTLNGVIALILRFDSCAAHYVTVVEDRPIMSVKYCLSVPVFHFWPKLTHPAARSLCDRWASCFRQKSKSRLWYSFAKKTQKLNCSCFITEVSLSCDTVAVSVTGWHVRLLTTCVADDFDRPTLTVAIYACEVPRTRARPGHRLFTAAGLRLWNNVHTSSCPRKFSW